MHPTLLNHKYVRIFLSFLQLMGTLVILFSPLSNLNKTMALLIFWLITFFPINVVELLLFISINIVFSVIDIMSIQKGIFFFNHPDIFGLPYYEFFMWGFYILHSTRVLGVSFLPVTKIQVIAWLILVILYSLAFSHFVNSNTLLIATSSIICIFLSFFHAKQDWLYLAYFIFMGTLFEYLGVGFGEWGYPNPPWGGVAFWYVTLWGGVGVFAHRLLSFLNYNSI